MATGGHLEATFPPPPLAGLAAAAVVVVDTDDDEEETNDVDDDAVASSRTLPAECVRFSCRPAPFGLVGVCAACAMISAKKKKKKKSRVGCARYGHRSAPDGEEDDEGGPTWPRPDDEDEDEA